MKKKFHVKKRLFWWNECYIFGQKWRYFTWNFFQIPLNIFLYVQTIYFKYWKHRLRSVLHAGKKIMSIRHVVQKISWKQKGRGKNCVISKILTPPFWRGSLYENFPPPICFLKIFFEQHVLWTYFFYQRGEQIWTDVSKTWSVPFARIENFLQAFEKKVHVK